MTKAEPYDAIVNTPLPGGQRLGIRCNAVGLRSLDFLPANTPEQAATSSCAAPVIAALETYFRGRRTRPIALDLVGTPYQRRVWAALLAIPAGEVRSYGALAAALNSGPRAIAAACRANPVPIFVPCHRVVAAHGLGGYMGATQGEGIAIKRWLLEHEGAE